MGKHGNHGGPPRPDDGRVELARIRGTRPQPSTRAGTAVTHPLVGRPHRVSAGSSSQRSIDEDAVLQMDLRVPVAGVAVLVVHGEVDMLTAPALGRRARAELRRHRRLVLDLDPLTFLGVAGLSALLELHDFAPGRVHLAGSTRVTRRLLELTGADRVLCQHRDAGTAIEAARTASDPADRPAAGRA